MFKLTVTQPFANYKAGDEITDQDVIKDILAGEQAQYVVKVAVQPAKATK